MTKNELDRQANAEARKATEAPVTDGGAPAIPPAVAADISVIIPCFNGAQTLGDQLDALASQTVPPIEIIVADNGSTDQSRTIVAHYRSLMPNLKLVDASARKGVSYARNRGAEHASSEALAFCDADDIVAADWVAAISQALTRYNFVASRQERQLLGGTSDAQLNGLQNFDPPSAPYAGGCGLGVKRFLHRAVGGFDESMVTMEDVDYCLRIQERGHPLHFCPDAVIHIRPPRDLKHATRQAFTWGMSHATLYAKHHKRSLVKRPFGLALLKLLVFCARSLTQVLLGRADGALAWTATFNAGVLIGSLRHGVFAFRVGPWGSGEAARRGGDVMPARTVGSGAEETWIKHVR